MLCVTRILFYSIKVLTMNHATPPPTSDELTKAYKRARLRQIGVSYQRAITTPCISAAMRCAVLAARKQQPSPETGINQGEVR